jgi:DNA-binding NtrC family response regulator
MMSAAPDRMAVPMEKSAGSILLVEDDVSLRRSLGEFLRDCGYRPYVVGTMREGWETVRAVRPAVCLLDLNLPDGSGLDLLRRIVQERLPTRVIVMTAFPLQHLRPNDPQGILAAWLTKPVAPGALLEAVEEAIKEGDKGTRGQGDKKK